MNSTEERIRSVIYYLLIAYGFFIIVYILWYYSRHSPAYATHMEIIEILGFYTTGIFAFLLSAWGKLSDKINKITEEVTGLREYTKGYVKGRSNAGKRR